MNKALQYILLFSIILTGFWFRFQGIRDNHSFWSDEAFVATLSRDILTEKRSWGDAFYQYGYQRLHLITTTTSMKLFGFNEFAARLPPVLFGALSIIATYLLASQLSNRAGGILAAFVFAFSQLMLANDTQAKTYSALTFLFVAVLYCLRLLEQKKKHTMMLHLIIIVLASLATLFHYLGILIWIPFLIYVLLTYRDTIFKLVRNPLYVLIGIAAVGLLGYIFHAGQIIADFFQGETLSLFLFPVNNITYFRELVWRNYAFLSLPAFVGMFIGIYEKKYAWSVSLMLFLLFYSYLWIFRSTHNIRYIVPFIGIIFVYFGVFWGKVAEKLFPKYQLLFITMLIVILYMGGYKIVRKPNAYYSPNADLYGDVQNADYKTFFSLLKKRYPDLSNTAVFTDWGDTQRWYLEEKPINAYFMKRFINEKPEPNIIDGVMMYGTLDQFLAEQKKYPKGLLVVEDWISFLPDEIKEYVKENLTLEYRVESLPQAAGDHWPLALYSWGMEEEQNQ